MISEVGYGTYVLEKKAGKTQIVNSWDTQMRDSDYASALDYVEHGQ